MLDIFDVKIVDSKVLASRNSCSKIYNACIVRYDVDDCFYAVFHFIFVSQHKDIHLGCSDF